MCYVQATTLGDFPAPISLCAITSLIGVIITAIVELVLNHRVDVGWPLMRLGTLICYSILVISHHFPSSNMSRLFVKFSHKNGNFRFIN
jgi:hypothetical protein